MIVISVTIERKMFICSLTDADFEWLPDNQEVKVM